MARIVLATIGSLGDLHPFIAIGRALIAQGQDVVLGVPEDGVAKVRAAGLEAAAILPSYAAICERLGMTPEETVVRVLADTDFVIDGILIPSLSASTAALDALAEGADAIAGSVFALAAGIVAEKRRVPLAAVVLQPMTLFSAWEPPQAPRFGLMRHHPGSGIGRAWNRGFYALARAALRHRHGKRINAVRAAHGLGPMRGAALLDREAARAVTLCCWSAALGVLPPDAPEDGLLTGFPFFDSESGGDEPLPPALDAFLREGEPPLVFTLGSFAVAAAGRFYEEAVAASRALGRRAVMLTGQPGPPERRGDCLFLGYAPHSAVFPGAAAVIHHGGIGTLGQAIRAGCPQVVVPHFGDQFDNAARVEAAGLGVAIRRGRFRAATVTDVLRRLLADQEVGARAKRAAETVAAEDGAGAAARRIIALCR